MVLLYMLTFGGILMGFMLPYIAAPWIRHGYGIFLSGLDRQRPKHFPNCCLQGVSDHEILRNRQDLLRPCGDGFGDGLYFNDKLYHWVTIGLTCNIIYRFMKYGLSSWFIGGFPTLMINHWVENWTSEDCKSHVSLADRHEEIHRAKDGDPLMLVKDTLMLINVD